MSTTYLRKTLGPLWRVDMQEKETVKFELSASTVALSAEVYNPALNF